MSQYASPQDKKPGDTRSRRQRIASSLLTGWDYFLDRLDDAAYLAGRAIPVVLSILKAIAMVAAMVIIVVVSLHWLPFTVFLATDQRFTGERQDQLNMLSALLFFVAWVIGAVVYSAVTKAHKQLAAILESLKAQPTRSEQLGIPLTIVVEMPTGALQPLSRRKGSSRRRISHRTLSRSQPRSYPKGVARLHTRNHG